MIKKKGKEMRAMINVGDKQVPFEASADTPRMYRIQFNRDLIKDIFSLDLKHPENINMEMLENISYVMAKAADPELQDTSIKEWLSQFGMFDLYKALPEIVNLWAINMRTESQKKKKQRKQ